MLLLERPLSHFKDVLMCVLINFIYVAQEYQPAVWLIYVVSGIFNKNVLVRSKG